MKSKVSGCFGIGFLIVVGFLASVLIINLTEAAPLLVIGAAIFMVIIIILSLRKRRIERQEEEELEARLAEWKNKSYEDLIRMSQNEYYQSYHWSITREEAFSRANNKCEICGSTHDLVVHHKTYENLGTEKPEDLEVLCTRCHGKRHLLGAGPRFP